VNHSQSRKKGRVPLTFEGEKEAVLRTGSILCFFHKEKKKKNLKAQARARTSLEAAGRSVSSRIPEGKSCAAKGGKSIMQLKKTGKESQKSVN